MEEVLVQLGNYGFPMVVAVYLLVRVEKKLEALTVAIGRLEQVLAVFLKALPEDVADRQVQSKLYCQ